MVHSKPVRLALPALLAVSTPLAGCPTPKDPAGSLEDSGVVDADEDGYGADQDCDDSDPSTHPGADETCDGIDNDCDDAVDEDATDASTWYLDGDGDGHGGTTTLTSCDAPEDYVAAGDDCDDADDSVHPSASEVCDGIDNDCDATVDEGSDDSDADGAADCIDQCPTYVEPGAVDGDGTPLAPFGTIADAFAGAPADCLDIALRPGTYGETIDYGGQPWRLQATGSVDDTVIEPPKGQRAVLVFEVRGDQPASLQGVTIRGGTGVPFDGVTETPVGGGIAVHDAWFDLRDCVVEDNKAEGGAGGFFSVWSGSVEGCLFQDNIAERQGGGVQLAGLSDGTLRANTFLRNDTTGGSSDGGALMLSSTVLATVSANHFEANNAEESGGAIRSHSAASTIINNLFVDNTTGADRSGANAVQFSFDDAGLFANNTLVRNGLSFRQTSSDAGYTITTQVVNNIIVDSPNNEVGTDNTTLPDGFRHNLVYDADQDEYSGEDPTGTDSNIAVDPKFLDPDGGDYCLETGSPAVDAGEDLASLGVVEDYFGVTRPLGAGYDLGHCESH